MVRKAYSIDPTKKQWWDGFLMLEHFAPSGRRHGIWFKHQKNYTDDRYEIWQRVFNNGALVTGTRFFYGLPDE